MFVITKRLKDYYSSETYLAKKKYLDDANSSLNLSPTTLLPPPVSARDIEFAEYKLGFKLPNVLKELYMQISNGRFAGGVLGIQSGWRDGHTDCEDTAVGLYLQCKQESIEYDLRHEWESYCRGILPLKSAGCGEFYFLDCEIEDSEVWLGEYYAHGAFATKSVAPSLRA